MKYTSRAQGRKATFAWQLNDALHSKDSLILPCALVLAGAATVLYAHMLGSTVRNFLCMVLASMFPLALLEKKILGCPDPLSAISKFSGKLLLSHASFFALRLPGEYRDMQENSSLSWHFAFVFSSVLTVCVLLPTVFRIRSFRALVIDNLDVWGLNLLWWVVAVLTKEQVYKWGLVPLGTLAATAAWMELMAFAPALATMAQQSYDADKTEADIADTRLRCLVLFACLLGFYFHEDVVAAYTYRSDFPLASMGHLAHFALLLDLAAFVLAHFFDPAKLEKFYGAIRDIFDDMCAV